ncbi:MAG: branched-chain amino acid ABC transporter substrate-binding protein [Bacillota bacterium]
MRKIMVCVVVLGLLLSVSAACAQQPKAKPTIKIGYLAPLTGDWAFEGQEGIKKPLEMLVEQVNKQGGLLGGRQIELISADDQSDAKQAALAAQKLITAGAKIVIGSYASTCTEPASQLFNDAGILHITPISTATRLTEKGYKRFFRTCVTDDKQGLFAAEFISKTLGKKRVAIIHDNTTYAKGLADWSKKYMEDAGLEVVFFDAITPKEKDYTAVLTRLKAAKPEVWYFTGYYPEAALLVRQAADVGLDAQMMVGNAVNNPEFVKMAGIEFAKRVIITTEPMPKDLPWPEARKFLEDYKARYGEYPRSVWAPFTADAFRVIVEAINRTNSDDPAKLAEYLHNELKDFPGISGLIPGFDEKGDRKGTIHMAYTVNDQGEFVLWK